MFPLKFCPLLDLNSIGFAFKPSKSSALKYFSLGFPSHLLPNAAFNINFDKYWCTFLN